MKCIKNECQLMERCDGHGGDVRGWRCVLLSGRCKEVWGGATIDRKWDSHQRDVKGIKEVFQLTERCDGYEGLVRRCGKVSQLSGSVTVLRRFVS